MVLKAPEREREREREMIRNDTPVCVLEVARFQLLTDEALTRHRA